VLIILAVIAVAIVLGREMWDAYMGAPWTREGTVRAYVVTMAPEVAGRIVELPVRDNQFVPKGDLLMAIDPTNYEIAGSLAEAAVKQAQVNAQNAEREAKRRLELSNLAATVEQQETFETSAVATQAQYQQAQANLEQARVNLQRTEIGSPVNGSVTNLLAQLGDSANVGQNEISLVDADSFLGRRLFRGNQSRPDPGGRPSRGQADGLRPDYSRHLRSIARGINVANAQPNGQGVATATRSSLGCGWRSASRCASTLDEMPEGVVLAAGMTATVQIGSLAPLVGK
jgi:multidrug resistance efflux pump